VVPLERLLWQFHWMLMEDQRVLFAGTVVAGIVKAVEVTGAGRTV
jgi:hypothetical protein